MNKIKLCDYGCGKPAVHQFKNGKWCCNKNYKHCIGIAARTTKTKMENLVIDSKDLMCSFGCGNPAKFKFKNGKYCCSKSTSRCPSLIKKQSIINSIKYPKKEKPELCDYGCGKPAKFYFKKHDKWCCSKHVNSCEKRKEFFSLRLTGIKKTLSVELIENNFILCSYGCGNFAKYKFKNGKYCCEKNYKNCPEQTKIISEIQNRSDVKERKRISMLGKNVGKIPWLKGMKFEKPFYKVHPMLGKKHSDETKEKCRIISTGKKHSDETKEKCRIVSTGRKHSDETKEKCRKVHLGRKHSEEWIRKCADAARGRPMSDKNKEFHRQRMLNGHAVYMLSYVKNPSKPQVKLYNIIKELYSSAVLNYPCYRGEGKKNYSLDIAIPDLKICFESDGRRWHPDPEKDLKRQKDIEQFGWKMIRYRADYIKDVPPIERIKEDIENILNMKSLAINE